MDRSGRVSGAVEGVEFVSKVSGTPRTAWGPSVERGGGLVAGVTSEPPTVPGS